MGKTSNRGYKLKSRKCRMMKHVWWNISKIPFWTQNFSEKTFSRLLNFHRFSESAFFTFQYVFSFSFLILLLLPIHHRRSREKEKYFQNRKWILRCMRNLCRKSDRNEIRISSFVRCFFFGFEPRAHFCVLCDERNKLHKGNYLITKHGHFILLYFLRFLSQNTHS